MDSPKLSIVSTFYNDKKMLKIVMDSVLSQDYPNIEHVITDAASQDGSVELLKEYEEKYERQGKTLRWLSEPDSGISDGFSKAIKKSTGEYLILATDPYVSTNTLRMVMHRLIETGADYSFGGVIFQENGIITRIWSGRGGNWRLGWLAATPTMCFKMSTIEKHLFYSSKYQTAADYDMQIRLYKDPSLKSVSIPKPIINYCAGGKSNGSLSDKWFAIIECQKVLNDNHVQFGFVTNICKTVIALCAYIFAPRTRVPKELEVFNCKCQIE